MRLVKLERMKRTRAIRLVLDFKASELQEIQTGNLTMVKKGIYSDSCAHARLAEIITDVLRKVDVSR